MLKKMLKNGIAVAARFLLSLRVGSGTGLAGFDGDDGRIMANGPLASFLWSDQANPNLNRYAVLSFVDPTINLNSWRALGHIQINTQVLAAVMKNSLRVGTGTGLAAVHDGVDGDIVASGAGAQIVYGDRVTPTSTAYGAMLLQSGVHQLYDSAIPGPWLSYTSSTRVASMPGGATLGTLGRSVRVGSGAGLDGLLANDGTVLSSGAAAAFAAGDRSTPATADRWSHLLTGGIGSLTHATSGQSINHRASDGAVYGPRSIRAGSGTLTALDGTDGVVAADGTAAALIFRDRANAIKYGSWQRNTNLYLGTDSAQLWEVGQTSGIITQDTLSALSPNTGVSVAIAGNIPSGTRLMKPDGAVYLSWQLTATSAQTAGYQYAGIVAAHRPAGGLIVTLSGRLGTGAAATGYINSVGIVVCDVALGAGAVWTGTATYYQ
jgi:hypothetical protein